MSEERIAIHIIKQAKIIRALLEYLSLKNKVLWEGTEWKSGSKTIDGIGKYQTVMVFTALSVGTALLMRRGNSLYGATPISYPAWMATAQFEITLNGDTATMTTARYLGHYANDSHGAITTTGILKIIGIDPILPDSLQEFVNPIGGGYCLSRLLGGGISALIQSPEEYNHSYKRYFKSLLLHKQDKCYRYLSNCVRGLQDKQLAKRCIPVFGRSGIQCSKHFNNSICIDSTCIKCNEFNVSSGKNDDDFWRRCVYILFDGGDARRRHHIHRHLSVLFRVSNIQRNAHCNKADIAVRGCAV